MVVGDADGLASTGSAFSAGGDFAASGDTAVTASSHSSLGRTRARMLRCGAVSISLSQGRMRGRPAFAATRLGTPVTGSDEYTKKEW